MAQYIQENIKEYVVKLPQHAKFEIKSFSDFLRTLARILKDEIQFQLSTQKPREWRGFCLSAYYSTEAPKFNR